MARRTHANPPGEPAPDEPSAVYIIGPEGVRQPADLATGGSRRLGRSWAVLSVAAALAVLLVVAIVTHHGSDTADDVTPPPTPSSTTSQSTPSPTESTPATTALPPWPTTEGVCGSELYLPVLTGIGQLTDTTGIRLIAGGTPRLVDVDSGSATTLPLRLAAGEFVTQLTSDTKGTVALIDSCDRESNGSTLRRLVRIGPDGTPRPLPVRPAYNAPDSLIAGGDLAWLAHWPQLPDGSYAADKPIVLMSTTGGTSPIRLPMGFIPMGGYRGLVIGNAWKSDGATFGPIEVFDLATKRIVAKFGSTDVTYTVDNGYVVWSEGGCVGRCRVHVRNLADGHTRTVTATLGPGRTVGYGAVSPDGSLEAVVTYNNPTDPRFASDHPGGPTGIAVLDLATGRMTDVPGIELPPKSSTGLAFAGEGQWLVMTISLGDQTRILLWRPGLSHPVDAGVALTGMSDYPSPLAVL